MMFMNEMDINEALLRTRPWPNRHRAARILAGLRDETNAHSDGWHMWPKPARAAKQLMELLQYEDGCYGRYERDIEAAQLAKALGPIKSFYTRIGLKAGMKYPEGM